MFFFGVGGEPSYYFWVPYSRGQGGVSNIQDGGFGVGEFAIKKSLIDSMDKVNTMKEKIKTLSDDIKVERHLNLEKDE